MVLCTANSTTDVPQTFDRCASQIANVMLRAHRGSNAPASARPRLSPSDVCCLAPAPIPLLRKHCAVPRSHTSRRPRRSPAKLRCPRAGRQSDCAVRGVNNDDEPEGARHRIHTPHVNISTFPIPRWQRRPLCPHPPFSRSPCPLRPLPSPPTARSPRQCTLSFHP